jgi:GTP cyclohydrolase II
MAIISSTVLTTDYGEFNVSYHQEAENFCVSLYKGDLTQPNCVVRLHSSCLFSETLHSLDCDCNLQLSKAMETIAKEGKGIIVYLYQEGRGHGLSNKIKSMEIERVKGVDTVEAFTELHFDLDPRIYTVAINALKELKVNKEIRLMTNNPRKRKQLEEGGFIINDRVILHYPVNAQVKEYLKVKKNKLGHEIDEKLISK